MKYKLRFGIRGGVMSQEYIIPTKKMAENMAKDITNVIHAAVERDWYGRNDLAVSGNFWKMESNCSLKSWTSSAGFVSLEPVK